MKRLALLVVLGLGIAAAPVSAQPRRDRAPGAPAAPAVDRKERIKKRIRALRAYTLTEELNLDEATASRLFPILSRYDDEIGKLLVTRWKLRADLDAATARGDDRGVNRAIDDMVANQRALWELDGRRFGELRRVLTPRQAGRLLVVLPALERRVQNLIQRALNRGAAGGGQRPVRPGDDYPDDTLE